MAPCPALADGRLPELPDPYEPLPLMFERGGGCSIEEFVDLYGVMIPRGSFESSLAPNPSSRRSPSRSTPSIRMRRGASPATRESAMITPAAARAAS
ncbi:hypothetical protein CF54_39240 [Streptomyces sp. F-3]|nr:hypothetical protein CF54_39240 [Streptomyces sp. F-3]